MIKMCCKIHNRGISPIRVFLIQYTLHIRNIIGCMATDDIAITVEIHRAQPNTMSTVQIINQIFGVWESEVHVQKCMCLYFASIACSVIPIHCPRNHSSDSPVIGFHFFPTATAQFHVL